MNEFVLDKSRQTLDILGNSASDIWVAIKENFAQINIIGFQDIWHNPIGIILFIVGVVLLFTWIKSKISWLLYLAISMFLLGYGGVLISGAKAFIETVGPQL